MFYRNLAVRGNKGDPIHVVHASKTHRVRKTGPLDQTSFFLGLPEELTKDRNFLLYRLFDSEKPGGKPGKVPVNPKTGLALNSWQDPRNWMTYEEAYRQYEDNPERFDGLGYALCSNGIACVDIDGARDDLGRLTSRAKELVDLIPGWVEISTSGNLHIWTRSQWPESKTTDHTNQIEVFYGSGFIALTGNPLDASRAIPQKSVDLQNLLAPYLQAKSRPQSDLKALDPFEHFCKRDANLTLAEARRIVMEELMPTPGRGGWLRVGMALHFQFEGDPEALDIWDEFSAREGCGDYLGFEDVRKQWDSFDVNHPKPVTFASLRHSLKCEPTEDSILHSNPFVELDLENPKPINYLLNGLVDEGITLISGASGTGKTNLLVELSCIVSHLCPRDHFLFVKGRRKVIYLTEDVGQIQRILVGKRKFSNLKAATHEINEWIKVIATKKFDEAELLALVKAVAKLATVIQKTPKGPITLPPLIIIDTASASFRIEDENHNSEVSKFIASLKAAIEETKASVWIVSHVAKGARETDVAQLTARGAGAWGDNVQTVIGIAREMRETFSNLAVIKNRVETKFNELEFHTQRHSVFVEDAYGDAQEINYLTGELVQSSTAERLARRDKRRQEKQLVDTAERERKTTDLIMAQVRDVPHQNRESLKHSLGGNNQARERLLRELIRDGYLISSPATAEEHKASGKRVLLRLTDKKYPPHDFDV